MQYNNNDNINAKVSYHVGYSPPGLSLDHEAPGSNVLHTMSKTEVDDENQRRESSQNVVTCEVRLHPP